MDAELFAQPAVVLACLASVLLKHRQRLDEGALRIALDAVVQAVSAA